MNSGAPSGQRAIDDPLCTVCQHPRSVHGEEDTYECYEGFGEPWQACDCEGFSYIPQEEAMTQPSTQAARQERKVTHEQAREAYFKLHNHVYNGAPVPLLSIPRNENDVDMILCDYIAQQASSDPGEARLREALEKIADHPHNSYAANGEGMYGTGVTDGHRCAAKIAETALRSDSDTEVQDGN